MERGKILIISLGRNGGLPLYANAIVNSLSDITFDIIVSKQCDLNTDIGNKIEMSTYTDVSSFLLNSIFYFPFKFLSLVPKMIKKYRVLYLPYDHFWIFPFILLFRLLSRKVILTVHDGTLHKGEGNKLLQFISDLNIRMSSELIFLTNYVKETVYERLNISKQYWIVPHGLYENPHIKISLDSNTRNLLFLGRIGKYKGFELLFEAALENKDYFDELIIAGKSLYDLNYVETDKIKVVDKFLTDKEIGEYLNWADALVLPYTEATQSGIIALGIYSELPMICTRVGGFGEQLNIDECIWISPNKESLQEALKSVFNDKVRYNDIKTKLKNKKASLLWSNISCELEKVLNS